MNKSTNIHTVGVVMQLPTEETFVQKKMAKLIFYKEFFTACALSEGHILSFKIESDLLKLRYETNSKKSIPRGMKMARIRTKGSSYITISEGRLPELFKYNIPTKTQRIDFKVENDFVVIDLSQLKAAEPANAPGFGSMDTGKIVEPEKPAEIIGFGRLSA